MSYVLNTPQLPMLLNTIHMVPAGNLFTHYTICPTLMAPSVIFEEGLLKLFINMLNFLIFIPKQIGKYSVYLKFSNHENLATSVGGTQL